MNKCILVGNLTRDPEISATSNGISVCKFSIAVGRNFTNASGEKEVDFFNIVAWRGIGENCGKYLKKGSKVAIAGRIETRSYEKDGIKRTVTDIVTDEVEFLNHVMDQQTPYNAATSPAKKRNEDLKPVEDDDLPF